MTKRSEDGWREFLGGYLRGLSLTTRYELPDALRRELSDLAERVWPIQGP